MVNTPSNVDTQITENSVSNLLDNEIIPHSYIESIIAREEEKLMEQAILASITDLENQNALSDVENNMNLPID